MLLAHMGKLLIGLAVLVAIFGASCVGSYNKLVRLSQRETLTAVTEARARVGQVSAQATPQITSDPAALQKFQQAQDGLSSALSRLLVVSERYPELKATANFRDLQAQLEGTENRIAVERMRFGQAAQEFNTARDSFPTVLIAGIFGKRFAEKAYFTAQAGAATPPHVQF
jgi:LemA protein